MASAVIDIPGAFLSVAKKVQDGQFTAQIERLGMKEGVVSLELNAALRDKVPEAALARVETARQQILAGELSVPSTEI